MTSYESKGQNLIDHLRELRKRIVYAGLFIILGTIIAWIERELLFDIVRAPIAPYLPSTDGGLSYTGPMESFLGYLKVAVLGGVLISCPLWVHQLWLFLAPALYVKEKRYALSFIFFGTLLFSIGVCFAYFVVYPFVFKFLLSFGSGKDQAIITISEYLSFFIKSILLFGMSFEMPLILTILGMVGVIDHQFLAKKRRHAILILSMVSALLTPPDPLSMMMLLIPLYGLYELSILSVRIFSSKQE